MADRTSPAEPQPDHAEIPVTAMATDGRGVGRSDDGKVVFVSGALPGETVRAVVTEEKASWRSALAVEVLEESPDRLAPPCPRLAEGCGGCQWQHVALPAQQRMKETLIADSLTRLGRVDPPGPVATVELPAWQFRTSFRAGVTGGRAALRHSRSHELVPIEGCLIAHPAAGELLAGRRYDGAEQVTVRVGATGERLAATTPRVAATVPGGVRRDRYHELVAGQRWRVSAGSFFQSRSDGAEALARLVAEAADGLGRPGRAVDLYSGVGLFAGVLAGRGWTVQAVEGARSSAADARANLGPLGVKVEHRDVNRWEPAAADLVVADPSRSGLGRGGVRAVSGTGAARVVLISCDVASLGRDGGLLAEAGYRPASVTAVDMFPHSFHIEAVTVFDRR